jgi:hypothetical protein
MYWLWFGCLCFVTLRGVMSHALLWAEYDGKQTVQTKVPGWVLISGVVSDFIVPLTVVAAALAFRPVPFNPC